MPSNKFDADDSFRKLETCPDCENDFIEPIDSRELVLGGWTMELVCRDCGYYEIGDFSEEEVAELSWALCKQTIEMESLADDIKRHVEQCENLAELKDMSEYARNFINLINNGHIAPEDF